MDVTGCRCALAILSLGFLVGCGGGGEDADSQVEVSPENNSGNPAVETPPAETSPAETPPAPPDDTPPDDTPPVEPTGLGITAIQIVDSADLSDVRDLSNGDSLDLASLPNNFNIIAVPEDEQTVESVSFSLSGCLTLNRTENTAPYTLQQEAVGFNALPEGTCTLSVQPFSEDDASGEEGDVLSISFDVVNSNAGVSNTPPQIQLVGAAAITIANGGVYTELGATASDAEDGDLTDSIEIIGADINTLIAGTSTVTYSVTDSAGATASVSRQVTVQDDNPNASDVSANIIVTTRVNGVSPEIVQFDAQGSTCAPIALSIFGIQTNEAIAWSELAYAFDFDDADSGNFETTGNPRNTQTGSSPLAAHTFHCYGENDPNWNAANERCEFNVGVRVQAKDGDFDDAFIQVNVQPLFGIGGAYSDSDIFCLSANGNYDFCPHQDTARHITAVPDSGAFGSDTLYIFNNDGGTYSLFCPNAEEESVIGIAYGPNIDPIIPRGNRPVITTQVMLGARPTRPDCFQTNDASSIAALADDLPAVDANGHLVDGWGYGQKMVGVRTSRVRAPQASNFTQFIDLDMDYFNEAGGLGQFDLSSASTFCTPTNPNAIVSCSDLPYQSYLMIADTTIRGRCAGTPVIVPVAGLQAGVVRNVFLGTTIGGCSGEHNVRLNGSHSTIFSNVFIEMNASTDDNTPGTGITHRPFNSGGGAAPNGGLHSFTKDPTDFSNPSNVMRGSGAASQYVNRHNVYIDNIFALPNQIPEATNGFLLDFGGLFSQSYGNTFNDIVNGELPGRDMQIWGRYITVRDINYSTTSTLQVGISRNWYDDNCEVEPTYNCQSDVYLEGNPSRNAFPGSTPPLSVPSATWR